MPLPGWAALLLLALLRGRESLGSSSHSLRYFETAVSEPGQGLPRFVVEGYLDDQPFFHYDSNVKRAAPRAPWMEKVGKEDPQYWDWQTQIAQGSEAKFRSSLAIARNRYNQSRGLHTFQLMSSCGLSGDRPDGGYFQFGYDGMDFIAFDKESLSWTAADAKAEFTKRKWEAEPAISQRHKAYLEETCVEWLRKYLHYGQEALLRKERPVVKVTRKNSQEGLETLLCQAHGFYPKEIDITWRKDGEVRQGDTFRGLVSPNVDGTYYTWISIEIVPMERSRYWCHVEHDGLQEPLNVAVEVSVSPLLTAVGAGVAVMLVLLVTGVILCIKKRRGGLLCEEADISDCSSDASEGSQKSLIPSFYVREDQRESCKAAL